LKILENTAVSQSRQWGDTRARRITVGRVTRLEYYFKRLELPINGARFKNALQLHIDIILFPLD